MDNSWATDRRHLVHYSKAITGLVKVARFPRYLDFIFISIYLWIFLIIGYIFSFVLVGTLSKKNQKLIYCVFDSTFIELSTKKIHDYLKNMPIYQQFKNSNSLLKLKSKWKNGKKIHAHPHFSRFSFRRTQNSKLFAAITSKCYLFLNL